jgi:hypothetical protein
VDYEGDKVIRVLLGHGAEDKGRIASQIESANVDEEITDCETAVRIWCRRRGMLVVMVASKTYQSSGIQEVIRLCSFIYGSFDSSSDINTSNMLVQWNQCIAFECHTVNVMRVP